MNEFETRRLKKIFQNEEMCVELAHVEEYVDTKIKKKDNSHIHDCCEIYYNISGDVSFAVEGKVYKIKSGEIFIAKPNEFHTCVYHTSGKHRYYCLWITARDGFEKYLFPFFNRKNAEESKISMNENIKKIFESSLKDIETAQKSGELSSLQSVTAVFNILSIISTHKSSEVQTVRLPEELTEILEYTDKNFSKNCTVKYLSEKFYLSRSKINRLFSTHLNTTPTKYVENKRLSVAKVLLENDLTVQSVCEECGFPDYSHFIALFKKRFGITPLKYKKTKRN